MRGGHPGHQCVPRVWPSPPRDGTSGRKYLSSARPHHAQMTGDLGGPTPGRCCRPLGSFCARAPHNGGSPRPRRPCPAPWKHCVGVLHVTAAVCGGGGGGGVCGVQNDSQCALCGSESRAVRGSGVWPPRGPGRPTGRACAHLGYHILSASTRPALQIQVWADGPYDKCGYCTVGWAPASQLPRAGRPLPAGP